MARCCASRDARCTPESETIENQFTEIKNQPELLTRHCTEADLIEKAADLWPKRNSGRCCARRWQKPQSG
jgi:hypothetical protein